jgi:hypothetical protein
VSHVLVGLMMTAGSVAGAGQDDWRSYRDPVHRFTFEYPVRFGAPATGSDSGFEERLASIRFAPANAEAVVTRGRVRVDFQAAGGLYDHFALQVLPGVMRTRIEAVLAPLTLETFCDVLARPDHTAGLSLPADVLNAARAANRLQYIDPRVERCDRRGDVIRFSRTAAVSAAAGAPRPHVYGAIQFLQGRVSSFQVVGRSGTAPPPGDLDAMARMAESFSLGQ